MKSVGEALGSDDERGGDVMDIGASPQKTPTKKRKLEDDIEPSPKRLKKMCKYGSKCYQTNPEHLKEFEHRKVSSKFVLFFVLFLHYPPRQASVLLFIHITCHFCYIFT